MESKRPTRRPPATPLRNYSSPRAAQLSNEPINTNRTRHEYDQPPANKTPPALRGMQPPARPPDTEGSSQRATHRPHGPRPAAPSQPRPFPAPPRPRRQRAALSSPRAAATGGGEGEEGGGSGGRKGTPRSRLSRASSRSGPCRPRRTAGAGSGHVPALSPRRRTASGLRARGRRCRRGRGGGPALPTLRRPPRLAAAP